LTSLAKALHRRKRDKQLTFARSAIKLKFFCAAPTIRYRAKSETI
jgi:hypothetical protein